MKMYLGLTKRNMLVYFKDRQAIIFSLLTSIIVFVLYLLFLRSSRTSNGQCCCKNQCTDCCQ